MKTIINLVAKITGLAAVLRKADGAKTYLGGGVLLASGGAKVLIGVAAILGAVAGVSDAAGLLALVKGAASLPGIADIQAGASQFALGLVAVGLRHAVAKNAPSEDKPL